MNMLMIAAERARILFKVKTQSVALLLIAMFISLGANLAPAAAVEQERGLPQQAVEIAKPLGFPITNSMVVTWIVAAALLIFSRAATRNMKKVPDGAQNFLEWLVAGLYTFLEGIIGPHLVRRTFWFFATTFIFILSANWLGLLPGAGTIGWGHQTPNGFEIDEPLFSGANADLNLTLAISLVFFGCWFVWALQEVGPAWIPERTVRAQGRDGRRDEVIHGGGVPGRRVLGDHLNSFPADLPEFSPLR